MIDNGPSDLAERVILVAPNDRELGTAPKLAVHVDGRLHRAFSVFVFDDAGNLLLQQIARFSRPSGSCIAVM